MPWKILVEDVEIQYLVFPEPVSAGLNPYRILGHAEFYKTTNEHKEPILIEAIPGTNFYRIKDGRHRVIASMMAGRKTVRSERHVDE